jgi:TPR repeat protein
MASHQLGVLYSNGLDQPISNRKAFRYFKKAAAGGIAAATRQVAIAYHTGLGAEQNLDQAIVCYERSANQGDPLAARDLGNLYMYERPNRGLSESWHKKAAALGNSDSAYELGMMYQGGAESKKYLDQAVKYKHHLARVQIDPDYVPKEESAKQPEAVIDPAVQPEPVKQ